MGKAFLPISREYLQKMFRDKSSEWKTPLPNDMIILGIEHDAGRDCYNVVFQSSEIDEGAEATKGWMWKGL